MKSAIIKGIGYGLALLLACNLLTVFRMTFGSLYAAGKWIQANPQRFTGWVFMALLIAVVCYIVYNNLRFSHHSKSGKK